MSAPEDDRDHHHPAPMSDVEVRARALEELLREKGLVDEGFIDAVVSAYANDIGPMNGARVVARAWVDAEYKKRLLADATAAIAELGYGGPQGEHMVVVENTPKVHNVVVCTLCSCYPWPVLGLPPRWYKSAASGRGWCASRASCCARWASTCPRASRSASGTRARRSAIWSSPSGRPGRRGSTRRRSRRASRAMR